MNVIEHFRDLSAELKSVKNRIRRLIGNAHWPTDGAWKESVIRTVIRGYLPSTFSVGSGFILTPDGPSTQIDILIFDDSAPVIFRDGDFVIVPADCVRAVIEVKTSLNRNRLHEALHRLNSISRNLRKRCIHPRPFIGLFCFEATTISSADVLQLLKQENGQINAYEISAMSFGDSQFFRYWEFTPGAQSMSPHDQWHAYKMEELSPGYFIHNIICHLFPQVTERAENLWFPDDGKEMHLEGTIRRKN